MPKLWYICTDMLWCYKILQDNKPENQASKAAELGSGHQLDDVRNLGTGPEDGGTVQSTKPFWTVNAELWI